VDGEHGATRGAELVLLVEDEAVDAFLVKELLAGFRGEFTVEWVRSLAEAEQALAGPVACVLLDLGLPDSGGLDALAAVLKLVPEAAVVVLTGLSDRSQGSAAVALGAQDYLAKGSIDGEALARSLRYSIARRRGVETARRLREAELLRAENARLERGLLPRPLVANPTLHWQTRYRPGGQRALLGGDFFDAVELADGTVRLIIGDVSGHGPDEAALGVALRVAWRTLVLAGLDPGAVLPVLQGVLEAERLGPSVFATVCDVLFEADLRRAHIRLAGHPAPLRLDRGGVSELPASRRGLPLGVLSPSEWETNVIDLADPWTLLLYSDGITDGRVGATSERLGTHGLVAVAEGAMADCPSLGALADHLLAEAERGHGGPLPDDVALFLLSTDPRWER
jgi:DNA-binding NarL/FixJ family response regulator